MHRTEKQNEASRANGAKSNGPATPEGKAASSRNGTTHGLFSTYILLEAENKEGWDRVVTGLVDRFQPADPVEIGIVREMASASWRAERAAALEAALINIEFDIIVLTDAPAIRPEDEIRRAAVAYARAVGRYKAMLELGRQSIRFNNLWIRLHKKLKELQKDRLEQSPGPAAAPPQPAPQKSETEPGNAETQPVQQDASPVTTADAPVQSRRGFFTKLADLGNWHCPPFRSPWLQNAA